MNAKTMTNSAVRAKGKKEVREIFKALGIKDGIKVKAADSCWTYWYNKNRNGMLGNYVIYESIDSAEACRADDIVAARQYACQIDVFTTLCFEAAQVDELIRNFEEALTEKNFIISFEDELYEPDTRLSHLILIATKLYF